MKYINMLFLSATFLAGSPAFADDDAWYNPPSCKKSTSSPAETAKSIGVIRKVTMADERVVNGKVVQVTVVVQGEGALPYYRGLENCKLAMASDKKKSEDAYNRYK